MIVLDDSAAVELVLALPLSPQIQDELSRVDWQIAAPQLLIVEVSQVLRRRFQAGVTELAAADEARSLLTEMNIRYFGHQLLAERIWHLRENLTAYDASYVALAELLQSDLLTTDARLAQAPGHDAQVLLVK